MTHHNTRELDWADAYYKPLEGARITKTELAIEDEYRVFPVLHAELANGRKVKLEISSDQEGNSGGFIFGLPLPENTQDEIEEAKRKQGITPMVDSHKEKTNA